MKKLTSLTQQFLLTYLILAISALMGFYVMQSYYFSYYSLLGLIAILGVIFFLTFSIFYIFRIVCKRSMKDLNNIWRISLWILLVSFIISAVFDIYLHMMSILYMPISFWIILKTITYRVFSLEFIVGIFYMSPYVLLAGLTYWVIKINKKLDQ